jgi:hypothetical protein
MKYASRSTLVWAQYIGLSCIYILIWYYSILNPKLCVKWLMETCFAYAWHFPLLKGFVYVSNFYIFGTKIVQNTINQHLSLFWHNFSDTWRYFILIYLRLIYNFKYYILKMLSSNVLRRFLIATLWYILLCLIKCH